MFNLFIGIFIQITAVYKIMHSFPDNHWSYICLKFTSLICLLSFEFIATVSVLLILLGRTFTVGTISTGILTMFPQTSFCTLYANYQICIKGILMATSLSSIGYRINLGCCSSSAILLCIESLATLALHTALWHVLHIHSLLFQLCIWLTYTFTNCSQINIFNIMYWTSEPVLETTYACIYWFFLSIFIEYLKIFLFTPIFTTVIFFYNLFNHIWITLFHLFVSASNVLTAGWLLFDAVSPSLTTRLFLFLHLWSLCP